MEILKKQNQQMNIQDIAASDLVEDLTNITHTLSQEEENQKLNRLRDEITSMNIDQVIYLLESEKYSQRLLNLALVKAIEINRSSEKFDIIFHLINSGANVNITLPNNKMSILMKACLQADYDVINLLIENKASINYIDNNGQNCLFYLLNSKKGDNADIVNLLISKEIDINLSDKTNMTPLLLACRENLKNCVKILLDNHVNINILESKTNNSPLHIAVEKGNLEMVKMLVMKNSNIKAVNCDGNTPINVALKRSKTGIYQYLIEEFNKKVALEKKTMDELYKDSITKSKINTAVNISSKGNSSIAMGNNINKAKKDKKELGKVNATLNIVNHQNDVSNNKIQSSSQLQSITQTNITNTSTCTNINVNKEKEMNDSNIGTLSHSKIYLPPSKKLKQNMTQGTINKTQPQLNKQTSANITIQSQYKEKNRILEKNNESSMNEILKTILDQFQVGISNEKKTFSNSPKRVEKKNKIMKENQNDKVENKVLYNKIYKENESFLKEIILNNKNNSSYLDEVLTNRKREYDEVILSSFKYPDVFLNEISNTVSKNSYISYITYRID